VQVGRRGGAAPRVPEHRAEAPPPQLRYVTPTRISTCVALVRWLRHVNVFGLLHSCNGAACCAVSVQEFVVASRWQLGAVHETPFRGDAAKIRHII
jgi:hypothetical protein